MATQGPLYAGTVVNSDDGGATAWTSPSNAAGDTTGTAATCNIDTNGGTSHQLRASGFGFTIPAGSTINGVVIEIENSAANANRHYQNSIRLLVSAGETGSNAGTGAVVSTTKAFDSWGGASDTWGDVLTPGVVNDASFGVSYKIARDSNQSTTTSVFRVRATVYYSSAGRPRASIIVGI